jgi:hypothetical protein
MSVCIAKIPDILVDMAKVMLVRVLKLQTYDTEMLVADMLATCRLGYSLKYYLKYSFFEQTAE